MPPALARSVPLCVDLDGTLIRSDLLLECIAALLRTKPLYLLLVPFWLLRGRAYLKRQLARHVSLDISALPWNTLFIDWLRNEHAAGRPLWLTTAADETLAIQVATYLGFFDRVLASDGNKTNLKGKAKYEALRTAAGEVFDYAGDSRADLAIWEYCSHAVVVNANADVLRQVRSKVPQVECFDRPETSVFKLAVRQLRVHQWVKNALIFVPVATAHRILDLPVLLECAAAALLFGLCSSAQYMLNDLIDLESDRKHPTKSTRPFASGQLPISFGLVGGPLLLVVAVGVGSLLSTAFAGALMLYFTLSLIYSLWLKRVLLVDVFMLSGLYVYRILMGHLVTDIPFSEWLIAFAYLLFLSLAFSKRATEALHAQASNRQISGRSYRVDDWPLLNTFGICSAFLAVVVFLMYLHSDKVKTLYENPTLLWLLCPLLLYWLSRIWMLSARGAVHEDPILFVLKDKVTFLAAGVGGLIMLAAKIGFGIGQ